MIFLIPFLVNIWVHWVFNPFKMYMIRKFKNFPARIKPIDCESCLSFWLVIAWYVSCDFLWQTALLSGLGYILGGLYSKVFVIYLNKFYARTIKRLF